MITSLALSIIAIASGTLLTYTYDEGAPLVSRLCSGACIGFACLALVAFVLALFFGLTPVTIIITGAILLLPFILLKNRAKRDQINADIDRDLKAISQASLSRDALLTESSNILRCNYHKNACQGGRDGQASCCTSHLEWVNGSKVMHGSLH